MAHHPRRGERGHPGSCRPRKPPRVTRWRVRSRWRTGARIRP